MHILVSIFIASTLFLHPYYVSIFEVLHNADTRTVQIAIKVFATDIELALQAESQQDFFIGKPNELPKVDSLITEYFQKHFSLISDGEPLELNYIGKETELEAIWCYFESQPVEIPHKLNVSSTVFLELFDLQNNIVHTQVANKKLSAILKKGNTSKTLTF